MNLWKTMTGLVVPALELEFSSGFGFEETEIVTDRLSLTSIYLYQNVSQVMVASIFNMACFAHELIRISLRDIYFLSLLNSGVNMLQRIYPASFSDKNNQSTKKKKTIPTDNCWLW